MADDINSVKYGLVLIRRTGGKLQDQINGVKDKQGEPEGRVTNLVDKVVGEIVVMRQEEPNPQGHHDRG